MGGGDCRAENKATTPENWKQLTGGGVPCPVAFGADEGRETMELDKNSRQADEIMEKLRDMIGVGLDGWVPTENCVRGTNDSKD